VHGITAGCLTANANYRNGPVEKQGNDEGPSMCLDNCLSARAIAIDLDTVR